MSQEIQNPHNKKSRRRLISNIIFLVLLSILVVTLILSLGEISKISAQFQEIAKGDNWKYLIAAVGLILAHFFLWPASQCIYGKALNIEATVGESYLIGCSEHFYNGITPFAAGGQPFQIYSYTKRNVSTAKATGVILASFVTFMIVTNAFALASLFFFSRIAEGFDAMDMGWAKYVSLIGLIINFLVLIFIISLGVSKGLRNLLTRIVSTIANWKFFYKKEKGLRRKIGTALQKAVPAFEEYCLNAQTAFKETWSHKLATALAIFIKVICMACYYLVPFFILKAVGIEVGYDKLILVMFATSFAINAVVWMPTPGGVGGIEFAFIIVIAAVTTASKSDPQAVVLIWRLLTYYLILLISFGANAIFEGISSHRIKQEQKDASLEAPNEEKQS